MGTDVIHGPVARHPAFGWEPAARIAQSIDGFSFILAHTVSFFCPALQWWSAVFLRYQAEHSVWRRGPTGPGTHPNTLQTPPCACRLLDGLRSGSVRLNSSAMVGAGPGTSPG